MKHIEACVNLVHGPNKLREVPCLPMHQILKTKVKPVISTTHNPPPITHHPPPTIHRPPSDTHRSPPKVEPVISHYDLISIDVEEHYMNVLQTLPLGEGRDDDITIDVVLVPQPPNIPTYRPSELPTTHHPQGPYTPYTTHHPPSTIHPPYTINLPPTIHRRPLPTAHCPPPTTHHAPTR